MWKWIRRKRKPGTRELLLEIIPKVELEEIVVPKRVKRKRTMAQQYSASLNVHDEEEAQNLLKIHK